jgi:pimeloyl-ACP methyl ester carboxylesterase
VVADAGAGESLSIAGGVAGSVAVTEDLDRAAAVLGAAAELLRAAEQDLLAADWVLADAYARALPQVRGAVVRADGAVADCLHGGAGAGALATEVEEAGLRLRAVAHEYVAAENEALRTLTALERTYGVAHAAAWFGRMHLANTLDVLTRGPLVLIDGLAPNPVIDWIRPDDPMPLTSLLNRDSVHAAMWALSIPMIGMPRPTPVARLRPWDQAGSLYATMAQTLAMVGGALEVLTLERQYQQLAAEPMAPYAAPRGVEDLMIGLEEAAGRSERGELVVQELVSATGQTCFVAYVRGTQDWGVTDDNIHDSVGNLVALSGWQSDTMAAVTDALSAAGANSSTPVMLVGHSQGGIAVTALAATAAFRDRFHVTSVVTAGAPVGRFHTPPHVSRLHLEHPEDVVAGLDGRDNPAGPSTVTVTHDLLASPDPEIAASGRVTGGAHGLEGYRATAEAVDAADHDSIAGWRESSAPFLEAQTVRTTAYVPVVGAGDATPEWAERTLARGTVRRD